MSGPELREGGGALWRGGLVVGVGLGVERGVVGLRTGAVGYVKYGWVVAKP